MHNVNLECGVFFNGTGDSFEYESDPTFEETCKFQPLLVCRDCGCAFSMYKGRPVDFSELTRRGFELDIAPPNEQNVIFFNFITNRSKPNCPDGCPPPKVECLCPLCRRPKNKKGYHYRDCTCKLCLTRRDECRNRFRYEFLATQRSLQYIKEISGLSCESGNEVSTNVTINFNRQGKVAKYADESEDFIPRNRSPKCPCHSYYSKYWIVRDPCPAALECADLRKMRRKSATKKSKSPSKSITEQSPSKTDIKKSPSKSSTKKSPSKSNKVGDAKKIDHTVEKAAEPWEKILSNSLSQNYWPLEPACFRQPAVDYFQSCTDSTYPCILNAHNRETQELFKKDKNWLCTDHGKFAKRRFKPNPVNNRGRDAKKGGRSKQQKKKYNGDQESDTCWSSIVKSFKTTKAPSKSPAKSQSKTKTEQKNKNKKP